MNQRRMRVNQIRINGMKPVWASPGMNARVAFTGLAVRGVGARTLQNLASGGGVLLFYQSIHV